MPYISSLATGIIVAFLRKNGVDPETLPTLVEDTSKALRKIDYKTKHSEPKELTEAK